MEINSGPNLRSQALNGKRNLAFFGGNPLFETPVVVGRPNVPNRKAFLTRVEQILDRGMFSNDGPLVRSLEANVAELLEVEHVVAVSNGTVAIELAARAMGLGGNVIVPSFTYVATPHALSWHGIVPKFCDIDPSTHNLDPARVEDLIDGNTTAILGVHIWGRPCPVDELTAIARERDLGLIFDAAHALACSYRGSMIGGFGDVEILSFHATKFVSTFEGGALATNDAMIAAQARRMRDFGHDESRTVVQLGTNAKMSEISAAMGLTGLEDLAKLVAANHRVHATYSEELKDIPGVRLVDFDPDEEHNYQYVVIEIDEALYGLSREQLATILRAENIWPRHYFYPPCHLLVPYRGSGLHLPNTEELSRRVMSLPGGASLGTDEVRSICGLISMLADQSQAIQAHWPKTSSSQDSVTIGAIAP